VTKTCNKRLQHYGSVSSAKVMMERDTGRSKGFGFVEMGSDAEAQAAIGGMNGQQFGGRGLVVNEARPMEARPPRTGGGGFGGGGGGVAAVAATAVVVAAAVTAVALAAAAAVAAAAVVTAVAATATKQRPRIHSQQKRTFGSFFVAHSTQSGQVFRWPITLHCGACGGAQTAPVKQPVGQHAQALGHHSPFAKESRGSWHRPNGPEGLVGEGTRPASKMAWRNGSFASVAYQYSQGKW
jgi:RNA recognition motif-containing protein